MALDEISYDLAVSSGRIPTTDATEDMCCKLPGTDFLSSKFWKKAEGRYSTSRSSSGSIASPIAVHSATDKNGSKQILTTNNKRFQHRRGGFFVNPLSEVESDSGHLEQHSYKMVQAAEKAQSNNASCLDGISPTTCEALRNQNIR